MVGRGGRIEVRDDDPVRPPGLRRGRRSRRSRGAAWARRSRSGCAASRRSAATGEREPRTPPPEAPPCRSAGSLRGKSRRGGLKFPHEEDDRPPRTERTLSGRARGIRLFAGSRRDVENLKAMPDFEGREEPAVAEEFLRFRAERLGGECSREPAPRRARSRSESIRISARRTCYARVQRSSFSAEHVGRQRRGGRLLEAQDRADPVLAAPGRPGASTGPR